MTKKKVQKKHLKNNVKKIILLGGLSLISIVIVFFSVFHVVEDIVAKNKEALMLENKLNKLKEEESDLNDEINRLQDPDYLARYAREKYFYSKEGELIIRIPENNKDE